MKKCELCQEVAKIHCDSDGASLCWDCDTKVHTANFIVEKHLRTLLCHICQALTPLTASGSELEETISLCHGCSKTTWNYDDDDDEDDDEEEEEDNDIQVQVVPLGSSSSSSSSSSSEISSSDSSSSSSNDSSM